MNVSAACWSRATMIASFTASSDGGEPSTGTRILLNAAMSLLLRIGVRLIGCEESRAFGCERPALFAADHEDPHPSRGRCDIAVAGRCGVQLRIDRDVQESEPGTRRLTHLRAIPADATCERKRTDPTERRSHRCDARSQPMDVDVERESCRGQASCRALDHFAHIRRRTAQTEQA